MRILANRNSIQGMVTYYVSLYGFVGSCIAIAQTESAWALTGFSLTLLATIVQDVDWYRRSRVHPHDVQLIEKLTELLQGSKADLFLKQHDFEEYIYDDGQLQPLLAIEENWLGVDYEFVSPRLQTRWQLLRNRLDELTTLLTTDASLKGANFYHLLPSPDDRDSDPDIEQKVARARRANELARKIFDDFQELRRAYHRYTHLLART